MSVYTSRTEADAEVISNLIKEIRRLTPMSLLQLIDGSVIEVEAESYRLVAPEELQEKLISVNAHAARLNSLLGNKEEITAPVVPPQQTAQPVEAPVAPTEITAPVVADPTPPPATDMPPLQ